MNDEIMKIINPLYEMQREIENRKEERKNNLNNQREKIETLKNNRLTIKSNLETQLNHLKIIRNNRISYIEDNRENEINEYFEKYYDQDSLRSISAVRNDLNKAYDDRIRGIEAEYTNQSETLLNQIAQLEEETEEEKKEKEKLEFLERQSDYSVVDVKEMREVKDQVRKELIARQKELTIKLNRENLNHDIIMQEMSEFKPEYNTEHQMLDTSREAYQIFWKRSHETTDRINEINSELAQINAALEMTKYTEEEITKGMYGLAPHEKDEYLRRKLERESKKTPIIEEEFDVNNDAIDLNKDVESLSSQFILPPPIITQKNINEDEITPTENETMVDNLDEDIIVVDDPKKDLMVADDPDEDIIVVDDLEEKEPIIDSVSVNPPIDLEEKEPVIGSEPDLENDSVSNQKKQTVIDESYKVRGIIDQINDIGYNVLDNFTFKYINASFLNINKDKLKHSWKVSQKNPFTAVSTVGKKSFGILLGIGGKFSAKMLYINKRRKQRIAKTEEIINSLSDEDIMLFVENYQAVSAEYVNEIPPVALTAISKRYDKIIEKMRLVGNLKITANYELLSKNYNKLKDLKSELGDSDLDYNQREKYNEEIKRLSSEIFDNIDNIFSTRKEIIPKIYGTGGIDNFKRQMNIAHNNIKGRKSAFYNIDKNFDYADKKLLELYIHYKNEGDAKKAAEMFFTQQQLKIDNTTEKNRFSLANWGSKVSSGPVNYMPLIETPDFNNYNFASDVLTSVLYISMAISLANAIKSIKSESKAFENYNENIDKMYNDKLEKVYEEYNAKIEEINATIQQVKNNNNPDELANLLEGVLKQNAGKNFAADHHLAGWSQGGTTGQAASVITADLDDPLHIFQHNFTVAIDNASKITDVNKRIIEYQKIASEMARTEKKYFENIKDDLFEHLKYQKNVDTRFESLFGLAENLGATSELMGKVSQLSDGISSLNVGQLTKIANLDFADNAINISSTLDSIVPALGTTIGIAAVRDGINGNVVTDKSSKNDSGVYKTLDGQMEQIKGNIQETEIVRNVNKKFEELNKKWDSNGFIYKIFHRKEKVTIETKNQLYREELEENSNEMEGAGMRV